MTRRPLRRVRPVVPASARRRRPRARSRAPPWRPAGGGLRRASPRSCRRGFCSSSIWAAMYTAFGKYPGDWLGDSEGRQVLDGPARDRAHSGSLVVLLPAARLLRDRRSSSRRPSRSAAREWRSRSAAADASRRHAAPRARTSRSTPGSRPSAARPCSSRVGVFVAGFVIAGWVLKPPPELDAVALPAVRRVLGRRLARDLRVGARESALADGPSAPARSRSSPAIGVARLWEERRRPFARVGARGCRLPAAS